MINIKLEGNAILGKILEENVMRDGYYIRFFVYAQEEENKIYNPTRLDFKVKISKLQYEELNKKLKDSKADEPVLKIAGNLEVKLYSVCIN